MIIMEDKYGHLFSKNYLEQNLEDIPEFKTSRD